MRHKWRIFQDSFGTTEICLDVSHQPIATSIEHSDPAASGPQQGAFENNQTLKPPLSPGPPMLQVAMQVRNGWGKAGGHSVTVLELSSAVAAEARTGDQNGE